MSGVRGRRPLATEHVTSLAGSEAAKQRLKTLLRTLHGTMSISEACRELGICPSRFHALRHQWLQQSLMLLEPRRLGRPPKSLRAESKRCQELQSELAAVERAVQRAQVRHEIDQVLSLPIGRGQLGKKNESARRTPRPPR